MNDRFVKLAYQAKLFDGTGTVPFEDVAKFAELIVRECAEFANNHNEEVEGVTLGVGQALKKHFGVEE
jgi:hypothetical protein